jgi:hypothetical protein
MAQGNWTVEFFSESPTSCMVCFQKANELTLSLPMQIDHAFEGSFETVSRRSTALALHPCGVTLIMPPFFIWVGNKPVASIIASLSGPAASRHSTTSFPRNHNRPASRLRLSDVPPHGRPSGLAR